MIFIPDEYIETGSCVFKLYYGDRYVIIKGKSLESSIFFFEKGYAAFIPAPSFGKFKSREIQKSWDGKNSFYFKMYSYIHANPKLKFNIEVLLESDKPIELLICEEEYLAKSIKDKKCLNTNVTAYIPKYSTKTGMYNWIPAQDVENFKKHLSS